MDYISRVRSWLAVADYENGEHIEELLPYRESGRYSEENQRQWEIEADLVERFPGCTYYSVSVIEI